MLVRKAIFSCMESDSLFFDGQYAFKRYFVQLDFVSLLLLTHIMSRKILQCLRKHGIRLAIQQSFMGMGVQVGMGINMGESKVDERGRVTIPKEVREKAGLKPGDHVQVFAMDGGVNIQKTIDLEEFIKELGGCITVEGDLDPLKLKEIWRTAP